MRLPVWLTLSVAIVVIGFGAYRMYLAFFTSAAQQEQARRRGGLYGMPRRTHGLIGIVYLLLGTGLVATSFGWNPLAGVWGSSPSAAPPAQEVAPK